MSSLFQKYLYVFAKWELHSGQRVGSGIWMSPVRLLPRETRYESSPWRCFTMLHHRDVPRKKDCDARTVPANFLALAFFIQCWEGSWTIAAGITHSLVLHSICLLWIATCTTTKDLSWPEGGQEGWRGAKASAFLSFCSPSPRFPFFFSWSHQRAFLQEKSKKIKFEFFSV